MTELDIQGMTCQHCKAAVEEALTGVAGVVSAEVDLAKASAVVTGDVAVERLIEAVQGEGFEARAA